MSVSSISVAAYMDSIDSVAGSRIVVGAVAEGGRRSPLPRSSSVIIAKSPRVSMGARVNSRSKERPELRHAVDV